MCLTFPRSSLAEELAIKPSDFDYLKIIGKGSFGKVLLARHRESNEYYAVKVLQKKIILKKKEVSLTLLIFTIKTHSQYSKQAAIATNTYNHSVARSVALI